MKPPRPLSETAKLAETHRLQKLRRQVAGQAIAILRDPAIGERLIKEPVTSEVTLIAATKELCGRKGLTGYHDVVGATCLGVWFRHTPYGKAVIAGLAPRPRDLARDGASDNRRRILGALDRTVERRRQP